MKQLMEQPTRTGNHRKAFDPQLQAMVQNPVLRLYKGDPIALPHRHKKTS